MSIIVPLFIPDAVPAERVRMAFRDFLAVLGAELRAGDEDFDVWLCDSGPGDGARAAALLDEALGDDAALRERVHYRYDATGGEPLSRAEAMNRGARWSAGELLLFLHIDCRLPAGALRRIREANHNGAQAGGFIKEYSAKSALSPLHWTEWYLNEVRTRRGRRLVGTNAMFLTRALAEEHPFRGAFLEDVELSDWLRRRLRPTALHILEGPVQVSATKYNKGGVWNSIAINAAVMVLYRVLRVPPELLRSELYRRRFSKGLRFWGEYAQTLASLIDKGSRRER